MGNVVGWVMAYSSSNRQCNRWAVSLLDVKPADQVLELGFGPGVAIAELWRRVGSPGHVYGIDQSDVMLRHATRRNAAAFRAGQLTLVRAPVEDLPPVVDGPFDVILTVNSLGSWPAPSNGSRTYDVGSFPAAASPSFLSRAILVRPEILHLPRERKQIYYEPPASLRREWSASASTLP